MQVVILHDCVALIRTPIQMAENCGQWGAAALLRAAVDSGMRCSFEAKLKDPSQTWERFEAGGPAHAKAVQTLNDDLWTLCILRAHFKHVAYTVAHSTFAGFMSKFVYLIQLLCAISARDIVKLTILIWNLSKHNKFAFTYKSIHNIRQCWARVRQQMVACIGSHFCEVLQFSTCTGIQAMLHIWWQHLAPQEFRDLIPWYMQAMQA